MCMRIINSRIYKARCLSLPHHLITLDICESCLRGMITRLDFSQLLSVASFYKTVPSPKGNKRLDGN